MGQLTNELALGAAVSMIALGLAPYFFPAPTEESEVLPETVLELLARYVYGTGSLLLGFTVWLCLSGRAEMLIGLFIITILGGGVVVLRYASKWIKRMWAREQIINGTDKDLK